MFKKLIQAIACAALLIVSSAQGFFEEIDPALMVFDSTIPVGGNWNMQMWKYPVGAPGSNKYVRPDAPAFACDKISLGSGRIADPSMRAITNATDCTAAGGVWTDMAWKVGILMPAVMPTNNSLRVATYLDGFNAAPYPTYPTNSGAQTGWVTVKTHPGHWPHLNFYNGAYDFWGYAKGDVNLNRISTPYRKLLDQYPNAIDWGAGFKLAGNSWGGAGSILQSFMMKDPWAQAFTTIVQAHIPETLMVRQDTTPTDGISQNGFYYRNPVIAYAWDGPDDVANSDILTHAHKIKGVYFVLTGNGDDSSTFFNKEFFTLLCDAQKIACFGSWRAGNHGQSDPGLVHSPPNRSTSVGLPYIGNEPSTAFSGPDSDARLDKILPVFTHSTQNFMSLHPGTIIGYTNPGMTYTSTSPTYIAGTHTIPIYSGTPGYVRGHWNLGLEWNSKTQPTPTTSSAILPIRYRKHTGFGTGTRFNINGVSTGPEPDSSMWIPDQGDTVTFNLTLRRTGAFALPVGKQVNYVLPAQGARPAQTGTVTVTVEGEVTIPSLTLDNSTAYHNLELTPAALPWDIVFSRAPYAGNPIPGGAADSEQAAYQHTSDVSAIWSGFIQSDVVMKNLSTGTERVVFNCTTSGLNCAAQEARVSPDGTKLVFSVTFGPKTGPYAPSANAPDVKMVAGKCAQLYIHDIAANTTNPIGNRPGTGTSCLDNYNGADVFKEYDRMPDWLSNNKLVFVSNRAKKFPYRAGHSQHIRTGFNCPACVSQDGGSGDTAMSAQLWSMDITGNNAKLLGPHDQMAMTPNVQTNGDIVYTCLNAHAEKAVQGAANSLLAQPNKNWLCRVDSNGADQTVLIHGHQGYFKSVGWLPPPPAPQLFGGNNGSDEFRALRGFAEIFPGKMAGPNYYRANQTGSFGALYGFTIGDPHVEGCRTEAGCIPVGAKRTGEPGSSVVGSGLFLNPTWKAMTPWGQTTDADTVKIETASGSGVYRAAGRTGYAAPWNATQMMYTWARGQCYTPNGIAKLTRSFVGEGPVCRRAIYRTVPGPANTFPMITNPYDTAQTVPLVEDTTKHVWDGRRVAPYQTLFGQVAPTLKAPLTGTACYIQVANGRASEIHPRAGAAYTTTAATRCQEQGCGIARSGDPAWLASKLEFLNVRTVELFDFSYLGSNQTNYRETMNVLGHKSIKPYMRQRLRSDGSLKMRVPCDTPLIMSGENKQGETLVHDDFLQSLRPGETRTCHGCHDGHSTERMLQLTAQGIGNPVTHFAATLAATQVNPPLGQIKPAITWPTIQPILTARCGSCHNTNTGGAQTNPYGFNHKGFHIDSVAYPGVHNIYYPAGDSTLLMYSRVVWDSAQQDWPWVPKLSRPSNVGGPPNYVVPRPCTSQWICKFAADSPLYWYATNRRSDGYLNTTIPHDPTRYGNEDIDFKVGHPNSGFTAKEKALLREWIDGGAQYK